MAGDEDAVQAQEQEQEPYVGTAGIVTEATNPATGEPFPTKAVTELVRGDVIATGSGATMVVTGGGREPEDLVDRSDGAAGIRYDIEAYLAGVGEGGGEAVLPLAAEDGTPQLVAVVAQEASRLDAGLGFGDTEDLCKLATTLQGDEDKVSLSLVTRTWAADLSFAEGELEVVVTKEDGAQVDVSDVISSLLAQAEALQDRLLQAFASQVAEGIAGDEGEAADRILARGRGRGPHLAIGDVAEAG